MNLNLRSTSSVLSSIPVLLGFIPTNSIVVIHLQRPDGQYLVRVAARYDVEELPARAEGVVTRLPLGGPNLVEAAILVAVVEADHDTVAMAHLDALRQHLTSRGVAVLQRLHTRSLELINEWVDVDTGQTGHTESYRDSELAAWAAVEHGRTVSAGRAALAEEFDELTAAPPVSPVADAAQFVIDTVEDLYDAIANPGRVTAALAARLGHVITESVALRDVLMAASAETPSGATVWTHVARQLRGSARVEALCVAAACHYAGGDAVRAGIAIDAVHDTARREGLDTTELTRLLDSTVQAGVDPHLVRQLLAKITSAPRD